MHIIFNDTHDRRSIVTLGPRADLTDHPGSEKDVSVFVFDPPDEIGHRIALKSATERSRMWQRLTEAMLEGKRAYDMTQHQSGAALTLDDEPDADDEPAQPENLSLVNHSETKALLAHLTKVACEAVADTNADITSIDLEFRALDSGEYNCEIRAFTKLSSDNVKWDGFSWNSSAWHYGNGEPHDLDDLARKAAHSAVESTIERCRKEYGPEDDRDGLTTDEEHAEVERIDDEDDQEEQG